MEACVVDDDVERAVPCDRRRDHRLGSALVRYAARQREGSAACGDERLGQCLDAERFRAAEGTQG